MMEGYLQMSREIRRVPLNWEHPKDGDDLFIPMHDTTYVEEAMDYLQQVQDWDSGIHYDLKEDPSLKDKYPFYWDWAGEPPLPENYRPAWTQDNPPVGYQVYENVSE